MKQQPRVQACSAEGVVIGVRCWTFYCTRDGLRMVGVASKIVLDSWTALKPQDQKLGMWVSNVFRHQGFDSRDNKKQL